MNTGRLLVQGGAALVGTALLAAAMWLYDLTPEVESRQLDPIRDTGRIGQIVTNPRFSVQVQRVAAARSLASATPRTRPPVRTEGVFLIVHARATSKREPLRLQTAQLETPGGYVFRKDPRPSVSLGPDPTFQPLIWDETAFVFELPPRRLAGARLVVGEGGLLPQLSAAAEIDLGLTRSRAADLIRRAAENYDLRAATS
ncbi:hypothetical protein Acsp04_48890 [Actinomadura sp. NBRC 104425]|uniref:hypothetical protein n=1 Tax=Actinomadura sp. NBRC 104425 TaxID=3032204 RepID=UPI0024A480EF|nr:hypothetical protein [Actinomadura sp. NBRC 104425]GLZ14654.1 hypothetical protein Acsp04_48890 [Actinomadura sp. NBRC 104425]